METTAKRPETAKIALSRLKRGFDSRRERQLCRQFPLSRGRFRRLAAGCYDLLILTGVLVSTSFVVIAARGGSAVPAGNPVFQGFLAAQVAAYFIGFWARGGQTPGMRAWRLRVQTVDGDTPSPAVAAVRFGAALLCRGARRARIPLDAGGCRQQNLARPPERHPYREAQREAVTAETAQRVRASATAVATTRNAVGSQPTSNGSRL